MAVASVEGVTSWVSESALQESCRMTTSLRGQALLRGGYALGGTLVGVSDVETSHARGR